MIGWLKDQNAYNRRVQIEAEDLAREYGKVAYEKARAAMREAAGNGDSGQERFFAKVAAALLKSTVKEFVRDTATTSTEAIGSA